jgi:3-oxoacyl-[acyl-carrier-protein] synthase-3
LVDRRLSRTGNRLLGGVVRANTRQCHLCRGGADPSSGAASDLLMWTDSESLLREGVATAAEAFPQFLDSVGWRGAAIDRTFCHQVGRAHRKLLLDALGLDPAADTTTLEWLGNTGSVALPITAAVGIERGHVTAGERVAMLGIGSGINVVMLGLEWGASPAQSTPDRNS